MPQADDKRPGLGSIFKGMMLLAVGKKEGLNCFPNSVDGFLASLAPQLACIIVGALQLFIAPKISLVVTKILLAVCVLLLPPVISQLYAQYWHRDDMWLRYVTASTWCSWVVVIFSMVLTLFVVTLAPNLFQQPMFLGLLALLSAAYECWLQWYIAKNGLDIGGFRAALLYLTIILATVALYYLVAFFPPHYMVINDIVQPVKIPTPQSG